ncbi:hypothetical protein CRUP_014859 [Coryphaenoides rupestris]|nr:hypothetical protein CRUP_014859 [Coryphaenoides rupestris]
MLCCVFPLRREDDLPPKRSSSVKAFHADASSSENDTLTSSNTYNSRYWHNPKANYDTHSYTRYNGDTRQTFSTAATHGAHVPHAQSPGHHGHHGNHAHAHGQGHGHAHHGHGHGHHGHAHGHAPAPPATAAAGAGVGPVSAPGSAPLPRHARPPPPSATTPAAAAATTTVTSPFANGSHTLPPKTLVVTTNSAPSPAAKARSNGAVGHKAGVPAAAAAMTGGGSAGAGGGSARGQHTHSYAVSQATLERMGAVPVMVPAQNRAGSLV